MTNEKKEKTVILELSRAEALVLFEWLTSHDGGLPIDDPSEQTVLWRIEGALESGLPEVLASDYQDQLAAARKVLQESTKPTK